MGCPSHELPFLYTIPPKGLTCVVQWSTHTLSYLRKKKETTNQWPYGLYLLAFPSLSIPSSLLLSKKSFVFDVSQVANRSLLFFSPLPLLLLPSSSSLPLHSLILPRCNFFLWCCVFWLSSPTPFERVINTPIDCAEPSLSKYRRTPSPVTSCAYPVIQAEPPSGPRPSPSFEYHAHLQPHSTAPHQQPVPTKDRHRPWKPKET